MTGILGRSDQVAFFSDPSGFADLVTLLEVQRICWETTNLVSQDYCQRHFLPLLTSFSQISHSCSLVFRPLWYAEFGSHWTKVREAPEDIVWSS